MNKRTFKIYFHYATTGTTLTNASTPTNLAVGEIGIFKDNMLGLAAGDTYARNELTASRTEGIYVMQRNGLGVNDFTAPPMRIVGHQITSIKHCAYQAPVDQVTTITIPSGTPVAGDYHLRVLYTWDKDLFSLRPDRIDYSMYTDGTKTWATMLTELVAIVNSDNYNGRRAVSAAVATVGPNEVLTLTGIKPVGSGYGIYDIQSCEVRFDACVVNATGDDTIGTVATTASNTGKGAIFKMLREEDYMKGYLGQDNRRGFPVDQPRYFANTAGVTGWDTVTIEHYTRHTTGDIGQLEFKESPLTTIIAYRTGLSGAVKTAMFGGFNSFIASTPGNFSPVPTV